MKKNILKRVLSIFGIFALSFLLLTCDENMDQEQQGNQINNRQDKVMVSFSVTDNIARTVLPQVSLEDAASYKLLGGIVGETETELLEFSREETTVTIELAPGTWNFTLNAYNEDNERILQSKILNRKVSLTEINLISFSLSVISEGIGTIQITVNFPEEAGITRISTSGDIGTDNFTSITGDSFIYNKSNIAAGDYFLNFHLFQDDVLRTVVSELVLVRNNLTSSKVITLIGDDLSLVLNGTVSIIGTVVVGETLRADTSDLNGVGNITYQWKRGTTIIGTDTSTYTVQANDVGETITVTVTRIGYIGDVTSLPTVTVPALINVILSSVTGDGSTTQTTTMLTLTFNQAIPGLTADDITLSHSVSGQMIIKGILSGSGPVYTLPISGFTSGGNLTVAVAKPGYTVNTVSDVPITQYSPPLSGTVTINGSLQTGQTLTAVTTNLGGGGTITYQWLRGNTVVGTNSITYTVVAADVASANFRVRVTRAGYSSYVESLPMLTGTVGITGDMRVGQTLIADIDNLGGSGAIFYQWMRGGNVVSSGLGRSSYIVQSADVLSTNFYLRVDRADNSGWINSTPRLTGTVSITGNILVGETLTANTSNLRGSGTISYQWRRNGIDITGATNATYMIQTIDVGSVITVRVTRASNSGEIISSSTTVVPLGTVSIIGIPGVGEILTVNVDSLGGTGTISYQWIRNGIDITGATNAEYTAQTADIGSLITVRVTRSGSSVTSTPVRIVRTLPWNTSTPPTGIGDGDNVVIEVGASGTLVIPENATVTIISSGTDRVYNGTRAITLNISTGARVIWRANYYSEAQNTITITNPGTFEVAEGGVINSGGWGNTAINTSSNSTIIVSGGLINAWSQYSWSTNAVINSTNTAGTVIISGGKVRLAGTAGGGRAINAAGTLNITGGLIIGNKSAATGANGLINKTPDILTGTSTIIAYSLGGTHASDATTGLSFLPATGANVSWGLRDTWETGINYRGNFFPVSGVNVDNRIVWSVEYVIPSSSITTNSIITIAAGASGTLTIPASTNVTIASQGTEIVDNGTRAIGFNIGANARVTWRANYSGDNSLNSSDVTVSGTGTFDVAAGSINNNSTGFNPGRAVNTSANNTIIVSGGVVSAIAGIAINSTNTSGIVTVSGGEVRATTGTAIIASGATSTVTVSGGVVSATTGIAINSNATATLNITGGLVIAQRNAIIGANGVITRNNWNALSGNGRIVGYAQGTYNAGTTGAVGTAGTIGTATISNGLIIAVPDGISNSGVTWVRVGTQSGVNYPGGGFFPVPGVTVNP